MPRLKPLTEKQAKAALSETRLRKLSEGLTLYRKKKELSEDGLAAELGISRRTVHKLLRGERVLLSTEVMFLVINAAGFRVSEVREAMK